MSVKNGLMDVDGRGGISCQKSTGGRKQAKRRMIMEQVEAAVWCFVDGRGETMARDELLESTVSCKRAK